MVALLVGVDDVEGLEELLVAEGARVVEDGVVHEDVNLHLCEGRTLGAEPPGGLEGGVQGPQGLSEALARDAAGPVPLVRRARLLQHLGVPLGLFG